MNLYKIERTDDYGDDSYISAIVAAESVYIAKKMHPNSADKENLLNSWTDFINIKVTPIGIAKKYTIRGVIMSSFNEG